MKGVDRYCKLCKEGKLTIATYNRPKELLNQRSEVFNICRHREKMVNSWIKGLIKIVHRRKKEKKIIVGFSNKVSFCCFFLIC